MSKYLNPMKSLERLRNDWNKHGSIIVAVDYDSTLVPYMTDELPYGEEFEMIRQLVRDLKSEGCTIIIFTASSEDRWEAIKETLRDINIKYDLFNESPSNIPSICKAGKVYANAYLDDRAGLHEVFTHLNTLVQEKKIERSVQSLKLISKQLARI